MFRLTDGSVNILNLDVPNPKRETLFDSKLSGANAVAYRADGVAMTLVKRGNHVEFKPTTGRPAGFSVGGMTSNWPFYALDGRLLYVSDLTGRAAWHPQSGKRIGPFLGTNRGAVYGVTTDGKEVLTIDEDRRMQLWRVPQPLKGSSEEVALLIQSHTGFTAVSRNVLKFHQTPRFPKRPMSPETDPWPPLVVSDFREIHDADINDLAKWFQQLPKSFRPSHLSVRGQRR